MADQNSPRGFGAAARVTALAASVMDLHVRIALQEVDREKRPSANVVVQPAAINSAVAHRNPSRCFEP